VVVLTEALGSKSWVQGTRGRRRECDPWHTVARAQRELSQSGLAATLLRLGLGSSAAQGSFGPCGCDVFPSYYCPVPPIPQYLLDEIDGGAVCSVVGC
jgi:hypothetical protein